MDQEESCYTWRYKYDQLKQEIEDMRVISSLVKENQDLRARLQNFTNTYQEECADCSCPLAVRKTSSQLQNTCNEGQFREELKQPKPGYELRTSSPVDFTSFIQSSVYTDPRKSQSIPADKSFDVKFTDRLLGEICYQLDRRILSYVFHGRKRLYGYTLLNIPDKIKEVSTHPLTGEVDEGYRLYLTQRYNDLMQSLNQLGFKPTLHPVFTEFIVNTYGILKKRDCSSQELNFNDSEFMRKIITTHAPNTLQKDLLLLFNCLHYMAERDKRPILVW